MKRFTTDLWSWGLVLCFGNIVRACVRACVHACVRECACVRACVCVSAYVRAYVCVSACVDTECIYMCVAATCVCVGRGRRGDALSPRGGTQKRQNKPKKHVPDISLHGTGSIWLCGIKPAGEDIGADNRQHA